jgi:predicted restriction endonuclease
MTIELSSITNLHRLVDQVYRLSVSLPDAPLERFKKEIARAPSSTEIERIVKQRIGQDIFRDALLDYWGRKCPLTGIAEPSLLRASHIVGWAECDDDAHRLDVHNGLLLSALWDAAFDKGLVSFSDDGTVLSSPTLSVDACKALAIDKIPKLANLRDGHRANLRRHRAKYNFGE